MAITYKRTVTNPYEDDRDRLRKTNSLYNDEDWKRVATGNGIGFTTLDPYIYALDNMPKDEATLKAWKEKNLYDYADSYGRIFTLQTEAYADKTNTDVLRTFNKRDENGNYFKYGNKKEDGTFEEIKITPDEASKLSDSELVTYEKPMSDYDYYMSLARQMNEVNKQKYLLQVKQDLKASQSTGEKIGNFLASTLGEFFISGVIHQLNGIGNWFYSVGEGAGEFFKTGDWEKASTARVNATMKFDKNSELSKLEKYFENWELENSSFRDLTTGNYTTVGKYLGSTSNTLGKMVPSMIMSILGNKVAGSIGGTAGKVTSVSTQVASTGLFYSGFTTDQIIETYNFISDNNISISNAKLLANVDVKMLLQSSIEFGLDKLLGASAIDKMAFGRASRGIRSSSLTTNAFKRIIRDAWHEGTEEVLQDLSDYLIDRIYAIAVDENFSKLSQFDINTIFDSFMIGALTSIAGSMARVATTKPIKTDEIKYDKLNNVKLNNEGNIKSKRLNQFASWEYGLSLQEFFKTAEDILNKEGSLTNAFTLYRKGIDKANEKEKSKLTKQLKGIYELYRVLTDYFTVVGQDRIIQADELLTMIQDAPNRSEVYNVIDDSLSQMMNNLKEINAFQSSPTYRQSKLLEKLRDNENTEMLNAYRRGQTEGNEEVKETVKEVESVLENTKIENEEQIKKSAENILNNNDGVKTVVVTKKGSMTYDEETGTLFVGVNNITMDESGNLLYDGIAEDVIIDNFISNIVNGNFEGFSINKLVDLYKKWKGVNEVKPEIVIANLLFDTNFLAAILPELDFDTYKFVGSFKEFVKTLLNKKADDYSNLKKKLLIAIGNIKKVLRQYCVYQINARTDISIFDKSDVEFIKQQRSPIEIHNRVLEGNTTEYDLSVIKKQLRLVTDLTFEEKTKIFNDIQSKNKKDRFDALLKISNLLETIFYNDYNGQIYMPMTSIPNRVFNSYLQSTGLTIQTLSKPISESEQTSISEQFNSEVNPESTLAYHKLMFEKKTQNKYTFDITENGSVVILEKDGYKLNAVGFSSSNIEENIINQDVNNSTIVEGPVFNEGWKNKVFNKNVDDATKAYCTIDDLILHPEYLNNNVRSRILKEYGIVNSETTALTLKKMFLEENKNITIIMNRDGTYSFGNVKEMSKLLKYNITKKDLRDGMLLSEIFNEKYIVDGNSDAKIVFDESVSKAEYKTYKYDSVSNTMKFDNNIYINPKSIMNDADLQFTLCHEFQHIIQNQNAMNTGFDANWITNGFVNEKVRNTIIKDVIEHNHDMFKGLDTRLHNGNSDKSKVIQIVNDYVYYASGESQAYGLEGTVITNFSPVLIRRNMNSVSITMPWGKQYVLAGKDAFVTSSIRNIAGYVVQNDYKLKEFIETFKSNENADDSFLGDNWIEFDENFEYDETRDWHPLPESSKFLGEVGEEERLSAYKMYIYRMIRENAKYYGYNGISINASKVVPTFWFRVISDNNLISFSNTNELNRRLQKAFIGLPYGKPFEYFVSQLFNNSYIYGDVKFVLKYGAYSIGELIEKLGPYALDPDWDVTGFNEDSTGFYEKEGYETIPIMRNIKGEFYPKEMVKYDTFDLISDKYLLNESVKRGYTFSIQESLDRKFIIDTDNYNDIVNEYDSEQIVEDYKWRLNHEPLAYEVGRGGELDSPLFDGKITNESYDDLVKKFSVLNDELFNKILESVVFAFKKYNAYDSLKHDVELFIKKYTNLRNELLSNFNKTEDVAELYKEYVVKCNYELNHLKSLVKNARANKAINISENDETSIRIFMDKAFAYTYEFGINDVFLPPEFSILKAIADRQHLDVSIQFDDETIHGYYQSAFSLAGEDSYAYGAENDKNTIKVLIQSLNDYDSKKISENIYEVKSFFTNYMYLLSQHLLITNLDNVKFAENKTKLLNLVKDVFDIVYEQAKNKDGIFYDLVEYIRNDLSANNNELRFGRDYISFYLTCRFVANSYSFKIDNLSDKDKYNLSLISNLVNKIWNELGVIKKFSPTIPELLSDEKYNFYFDGKNSNEASNLVQVIGLSKQSIKKYDDSISDEHLQDAKDYVKKAKEKGINIVKVVEEVAPYGSKYMSKLIGYTDTGKRVVLRYYQPPRIGDYISESDRENTNLRYIKRTQLSKNIQRFIINADEKQLDESLWDKIKNDTITKKDIDNWIRDTDFNDMDEYTFNLISTYIYENNNISTPSQLEYYVDRTGEFYALKGVIKIMLKNGDLTEKLEREISNAKDIKTVEKIVEILKRNDMIKKIYDDIKNKFDKDYMEMNIFKTLSETNKDYERILKKFEENPVSEKYLKTLWLRIFDGSLQSAIDVSSIAKAVAYNAKWRITGEVSTVDLGETDDGRDVIENIAAEDEELVDDEDTFTDYVTYKKDNDELEELLDWYSIADIYNMYKQNPNNWKNLDKESLKKYMTERRKKTIMALGKMFNMNKEQIENENVKLLNFLFKIGLENATENQIKALGINGKKNVDNVKHKGMIARLGEDILKDLYMNYMSQIFVGEDFLLRNTISIPKNMQRKKMNSIYHLVNTIENNVKPVNYKNVVKNNSDILQLKKGRIILKPEAYLDEKGEIRLTETELTLLKERLKELSQAIRSEYKLSIYNAGKKNYEREIKKIKKQLEAELKKNEKLEKESSKQKDLIKAYENATITVDNGKVMPEKLDKFLSNSFSKVKESKTQLLTNADKHYIQTTITKFLRDNDTILSSLNQTDVDEILDYVLNTSILPDTESARTYMAIQVTLLSYILSVDENKVGAFKLTNEQRDAVEKRLQYIVSMSAQNIANWRAALKYLKSHAVRIIVNSSMKKFNLEYEGMEDDTDAVVEAVRSGDIKEMERAKDRMYKNVIRNCAGNKQSIFDRLFRFERASTLSGPGTWIRNQVSNINVTSVNFISDWIGKIFPNRKLKNIADDDPIKKQYTITGTKVTNEIKEFIQTAIINSGFLKLIGDNLSKYDPRQTKKLENIPDNLANLIVDKLISDANLEQSGVSMIREKKIRDFKNDKFAYELFDKNTGTSVTLKYSEMTEEQQSQALNEMVEKKTPLKLYYQFVFKMLGDKTWINKAFIRYFGKMLTEDNVDVSKSINPDGTISFTEDVVNIMVDAYALASRDYMHKTNFVYEMEGLIRRRFGKAGYFLYKQVFPFLGPSLNWAFEGLKLTPLGLVRAIIRYAKMEKTMSDIQDKIQAGEKLPSARLTQYLVKRDLGKGILGTIGWVIGIVLAATGAARIDDEDDKYKLIVGDVKVDISQVFGSQGIMQGIIAAGMIKAGTKDGKSFEDILFSTLNGVFDQMFIDTSFSDLFNSFRYSDSISEYLSTIPYSSMAMFIPNFIKYLTFTNKYTVNYEKGIVGRFERLAVQAIPSLSYALPHKIDPYTGEDQVQYRWWFLTQMFNKSNPMKIYPYNVSEIEKIAIGLELDKSDLSGSYTVNGNKVNLSKTETEKAGKLYGKLNNKYLTDFVNNKTSYRVKDKNGKLVELKYNKMTDEQRKNVFNRIMSDNSDIAKIYVLTSTGKYKYYADEELYSELRKLGIKTNVYKKTEKREGFVEI